MYWGNQQRIICCLVPIFVLVAVDWSSDLHDFTQSLRFHHSICQKKTIQKD